MSNINASNAATQEPLAEADTDIANSAPDWLGQRAIEAWEKIAPDLRAACLLNPSGEFALARYCDAIERWHAVRERVNRLNETYETVSKHGKLQRINPDFKVLGELESWLTAFEDRFGLSPMMRTKLKALRQNVGEADFGNLPLGQPASFGVPPDPNSDAPAPANNSPFGMLN